jgi:uncharacterized membrane protein
MRTASYAALSLAVLVGGAREVSAQWTIAPPSELPTPQTPNQAEALATNEDGSLIVGFTLTDTIQIGGLPRATYWKPGEAGSHLLPFRSRDSLTFDLALAASGTRIAGMEEDGGFTAGVYWDLSEPGSPGHLLPRSDFFGNAAGIRGTLVVGQILDGGAFRYEAALWNVSDSTQIPVYPLKDFGGFFNQALDVEGTRAVGYVAVPDPTSGLETLRAALWDISNPSATTASILDFGALGSSAQSLSGNTIVGVVEGRAAVWDVTDLANPVLSLLPDLGPGLGASAQTVRGTLVMGYVGLPNGDPLLNPLGIAAYWDLSEWDSTRTVHPLHTLDPLPGSPSCQACGVTGSRIVGFSARALQGSDLNPLSDVDELRATYWDRATDSKPQELPAGTSPVPAGAVAVSGPYVAGVATVAVDGYSFPIDQPVGWNTSQPGSPMQLLATLGNPQQGFEVFDAGGNLAVGWIGVPNSFEQAACFWDLSKPGGPITLLKGAGGAQFSSSANAISGNRIVGWSMDPNYVVHAALWDAANPQSLPILLDGAQSPMYSQANSVSGTIAVGYYQDASFQFHVGYWDLSQTSFPFHEFPQGSMIAVPEFVSGTYIVGVAYDLVTFGAHAAWWNVAEPGSPLHILPDLGGPLNVCTGVSGTLAVGAILDPATDTGESAFCDLSETGTPLRLLPGLVLSSPAIDGLHIVETVNDGGIGQAALIDLGLFTMSSFGQPLGNTKQLGSVLPVKFNFSYRRTPVTSQAQLNGILESLGFPDASPSIEVFAMQGSSEVGLDLGADPGVGDVGDLFRADGTGGWSFNLSLDPAFFVSKERCEARVGLGAVTILPGNRNFSTK